MTARAFRDENNTDITEAHGRFNLPELAKPVKRKTPSWLLFAVVGAVVLLAVVALVRFAGAGGGEGGGDTLNVAGRWHTNYGVLTLTQNGTHITGAYDGNGGVTGELNGAQVTGYWGRTGPTALCPEARDGTRWWGRFVWTFNETNTSFTGANSACDTPPRPPQSPWAGSRIGPPP